MAQRSEPVAPVSGQARAPIAYMYITNNPEVARIAELSGVDRIFVDLERLGKDARQRGLDTVKSDHRLEDVHRLRNSLTTSQLLVRTNPPHKDLQAEIESLLEARPDILMLPYFSSPEQVESFVQAVSGRALVSLLCETPGAMDALTEITSIPGVDEVHLGLNDLALAYGRRFMFEFFVDGLADRFARSATANGLKFGIGGVGRVGNAPLPAECILREHYRLGSTRAILSRSFCDATRIPIPQVERVFRDGIPRLREVEALAALMSPEELDQHSASTRRLIAAIALSRDSGPGRNR